MSAPPIPSFYKLAPPYRHLVPVSAASWVSARDRMGAALVWAMHAPPTPDEFEQARGRPPGVTLLVVLPPAEALHGRDDLLRVVELCRPHSVLPHHDTLHARELRDVLRREPLDLAAETVEYLEWRGLVLEGETRELIRRIVDRSLEIRTVSGLARALYRSRRALGRRFTTRGLPVPSHWLHFSRVLRAATRLQGEQESLFTVAVRLGYPDGFALSNQMKRLTGHRPSRVRRLLGWEWLMEAWIQTEIENEGFSARRRREMGIAARSEPPAPALPTPPSLRRGRPRPQESRSEPARPPRPESD